jgi:hypothetical protein
MLTDDIMATRPPKPGKIENPFAEYRHNNRYGVLRVRWPFWLVMVLLLRHLLLLLMIGLSHRGAAGDSVGAFATLIDPKFIPADAPAVILLFATGARVPKSGALARFLWRNGRMLMTLSIATFLGILFWREGHAIARYTLFDAGEIAANLALVAYIWLSRYLRDLFAQFPAQDVEGK